MGELEPCRRDRRTEVTCHVEVAVGLVFVLPAAWLLGRALQDATGRRRALPPSVGKEREPLTAIRDIGGTATAAEATMVTSLGVKEAKRMLSGLAAGGHLRVEVRTRQGLCRTRSRLVVTRRSAAEGPVEPSYSDPFWGCPRSGYSPECVELAFSEVRLQRIR